MRATFRYVLLTAIRDRFPVAIAIVLMAMTALARLMGSSAIVEQREMSLAYAGELMRLSLVLGLVTFVSFHVRNLHESREIEAILTRPIARAGFVIAYFGAFATLAAPLVALTGMLMMAGLGAHGAGLAEWLVSMALEVWIVVAMALFAAMALTSATASVLTTLGLYALGRTAAFFLAIVLGHSAATESVGVYFASGVVMTAIQAVMPRLDLFGQSRWLVDGPGGDWGLAELALQAAIYIPLLLVATVRDLRTKTF